MYQNTKEGAALTLTGQPSSFKIPFTKAAISYALVNRILN